MLRLIDFKNRLILVMDNQNEINLKRGLDVVQRMIDISADRLEGLRTQCNSSAELTQQEIRTLESKLVKMFSELLIRKEKLPESLQNVSSNGQEIKQWLRVVGLSDESLNIVLLRINSLETLMCTNDVELRTILADGSNVRDEEVRRLLRAMNCLRMSQTSIKTGRKEQSNLFWDSWDRHHNSQMKAGISPRTDRGKLMTKGNRYHNLYSTNHDSPVNIRHEQQTESPLELSPPEDLSFHTLTPSPSPPNSPANKTRSKAFPTTPPPKKKHQTLVSAINSLGTPPSHVNNTSAVNVITSNVNSGPVNVYDQKSLSKSQSHEFQLIKSDQSNQDQQTPPSQNPETSHSCLINSNSHQLSLSNKSSNGNSVMPDSKEHIQSSTTTLNSSEFNTFSVPTPRSRLHTEPGK